MRNLSRGGSILRLIQLRSESVPIFLRAHKTQPGRGKGQQQINSSLPRFTQSGPLEPREYEVSRSHETIAELVRKTRPAIELAFDADGREDWIGPAIGEIGDEARGMTKVRPHRRPMAHRRLIDRERRLPFFQNPARKPRGNRLRSRRNFF